MKVSLFSKHDPEYYLALGSHGCVKSLKVNATARKGSYCLVQEDELIKKKAL